MSVVSMLDSNIPTYQNKPLHQPVLPGGHYLTDVNNDADYFPSVTGWVSCTRGCWFQELFISVRREREEGNVSFCAIFHSDLSIVKTEQ